MTNSWKYISNQMEVITQRNVKMAVILSIFHDTTLKALLITYPILQTIYDRYHTIHVDFLASYTIWASSGAAKQGNKVSVSQLLVISKNQLVDEWLPAIILLHNSKSARYKSLFPNKLKPFNKGSIDSRIAAYNVLATNIGAELALATVKTAVLITYNQLLTVRTTQSTSKTNTTSNSGSLELLRIAAMNMQYRNVGFITDNFFETRETMCNLLFDLVTMRSKPQTTFKGKILVGETKTAFANTFLETDTIQVKIAGTGLFTLYLSTTPNVIDSTGIEVSVNIKVMVAIADFNVIDYINHRYLTIVSASTDAASYTVKLL